MTILKRLFGITNIFLSLGIATVWVYGSWELALGILFIFVSAVLESKIFTREYIKVFCSGIQRIKGKMPR